MNKGLTSLEALEKIGGILQEELIFHEDVDRLLKPIETALKEYEELQNDYCKVVEERGKWQKEAHKKLEALEIIVKKQVNIYYFYMYAKNDANYETYRDDFNAGFPSTKELLNQEEFDLLKEILK